MHAITNDNERCAVALEALRRVMDPEIGLNVVDLGLIYQLDFDVAEKKLFFTMTLTTQFCPMGESITDASREALKSVFPDFDIILALTFDPVWNHDRITPSGLEFLNKV